MNKQWRLKKRPEAGPSEDCFELVEADIPALEPGKALIKTRYLGVAPVMLRYMQNETDFESALALGDLMIGRGVGEVIASDCPTLPVGALVQARIGWQEYALIDEQQIPAPFILRHRDLPASHGLSSLGPSGFTALIGLREIGQLKPNDAILVSGAAGGVGSQVAQVAKALGAKRVVGIAGGPTKCAELINSMGYDAAIDYQSEDVPASIDTHFPEGIDLFFDNVGGALLDDVLARIRRRARIVICGSISEYLLPDEERHRFANLQNLGRQDARMEAFFIFDYLDNHRDYSDCLADFIRNGQLTPIEHLSEGIETLPTALCDLYRGNNIGVRIVKVAAEADGND